MSSLSWGQIALLGFINGVSIFATLGFFRWLDMQRKRKIAELMISEIEDKISNELNFNEIVKEFYQKDKEDED